MTAIRLGTATLVVLVALTCDITEVAGPPQDSPDAELALTPQDRVQGLFDQLDVLFLQIATGSDAVQLAYLDLPLARDEDRERDEERRGEENREGETPRAIVVPQTIVESDSPREADLVLADEPLVRVGLLDGPDEYLSAT